MTVSLGVAGFPVHAEDTEDLVSLAARGAARREGRGQEPGRSVQAPSMTTPRRTAGSAALLVVVIALSMQTGSALAGRLIESTGVVETLWLRTAIAAAILAALRPRSLRIPAAGDRLPLAALTLALLLMNLSFYAAISRAPLGIVVAVEFTGPLAVAVIGSRRAIDFVWIALAGLAVVLLAGPIELREHGWPRARPLRRGSLGRLPAARQACRHEHGPSPGDDDHAGRLGRPAHPGPRRERRRDRTTSVAALVMGAAIAVLSSAFPYFLELFALSRVRAATYGVLLSIEPAIAALTGFLILGQRLTLVEGAAIAAVMAAAAGASWTSEPHRP